MPQITIRTSEVFHNTGTSNSNGVACKFLVNQLLALDPELSIAEVITDNAASYAVRLKVNGDPSVGFYINNSGTTLSIYAGYWNDAGEFLTIANYGYVAGNFLGYYSSYSTASPSWYAYLKVTVVGVDGVLKYILFSSSYLSTVPYMCYGMFTSTAYPEPQYCIGCCNNNAVISSTYPALPVLPFASTVPTAIRDPINDTYDTIQFTSFGETLGFIRAGYSYALLPKMYYATSTSKGFLNIKWGGKYNIYHLTNSSGVVKTQFGETVIVGGVQMLSPGYVTVIE